MAPTRHASPFSDHAVLRRGRRTVGSLTSLAVALGLGLPVLVGATAGPAAAAIDPDAALAGIVVDDEGAPVAGAVVSVLPVRHDDDFYAFRTPEVVATATTAADGTYAVAELEEGEYGVVVTPASDDPRLLASESRETWVEDNAVEDFELTVSTLRGTVTRGDGTPAAVALVEAGQTWDEGFALTGPDGAYRLAPEPGDLQVAAYPPVVNPALDVSVRGRTTAPEAGEVEVLDLQLRQPNVRSTVLGPDGTTALAGALVRVVDLDTGEDVAHGRMASRSDGTVGFALEPGRYQFAVTPPAQDVDDVAPTRGPAFDVTDLHDAAHPLVQDVTMLGTTLTGVVRDPAGNPVPRAIVHAYHLGTRDLVFSQADDAGRYGFRIPAGSVRLSLYPPRPTIDYVDTTVSFDVPVVPATRDVAFRAPNVVGRVVDADGLPLVDINVSVSSGPVGPDDISYSYTDGQGRFAMLLSPGAHRLVVDPDEDRHPQAVRTATVVEVADTGTTEPELVADAPTAPAYELMRLPVELDGEPAYRVDEPTASGDGSVVAVRAEDRFTGCDCEVREGLPTDGRTDGPDPDYDEGIVLYDVPTGEQELLTAPNGVVVRPYARLALDADGDRVVLVTDQGDLTGEETGDDQAYVIDRTRDTVVAIEPPAAPSEDYLDPWYDDGQPPAVSADGRTLVLVVEHEDEEWNRVHSLEVVRLGPDDEITDRELLPLGGEIDPRATISADGSTLAFLDLVDGSWRLRVRDLATGAEEEPRPVYPAGDRWNPPYAGPSLSADGSVVAYPRDLLRPRDGGGNEQVGGARVWDRGSGEVQDVELFAGDGGPLHDGIQTMSLSGDGRELVVLSDGPFPEDDSLQAWSVDLGSGLETLVSADGRGQPGRQGVDRIAVPAQASPVAMATTSGNLTGVVDTSDDEEALSDRQVVLAFGEEVPPEWPDGAALTTEPGDIGSTTVRVRWSEATDNVAVSRYRVYVDGELAGTTAAETRVLRLTGLRPDTEYAVTVQAVDSRGSESTDGPSLSLRTLPSDSVELRPLEGATSAGGRVSLSWEAPEGADEVVVRRFVGDSPVDDQVLPADAAETTQGGLAADTAYGFQVFVRSGGDLRPFTERIELTTRPLTFASLTWEPELTGGFAARGASVPVTAVAESGRAVTVEVDFLSWYDDAHVLLDEPAPRSSVLTLTEDEASPGTYRGAFELVDGIAEVRGMTGTVSDGAGHELARAAAREPVPVGGDLAVDVQAPAGALPGGYVHVGGPQWYGSSIEGGGVLTFPGTPVGSYEVQVYDGFGDRLATERDVEVRHGLLATAVVRPSIPASLQVDVRDAEGQPVPQGILEFRDHATGAWLGDRYLSDGGSVTVPRLREGMVVDVVPRYPEHRLLVAQAQQVTLAAGPNRLEVVAPSVPRRQLSGRVTYDDGDPVEGARVRLVQVRNGYSHTLVTQSDADGAYQLRGLAGTGQLSVTAGVLSHRSDVDLTGGPAVQDVTLHGPRLYTLRLRLFTRSPGASAEVGPVALDWRTAVHYGMSLRANGREHWYTEPTVADDGSTLVAINAAPGERLEWCIDGREPRLLRTCTQTTLGSDRSVTLEMHAGPVTEVSARPVDDGAEVHHVRGDLYRLDDSGRALVSSRSHYGQVREVAEPGDYELVLTAGDRSGRVTFAVAPEATLVELGDIELDRAARFSGTDNEVRSARTQALPGSSVELRATWRNNAPGPATGTVARVTVPTGTSLVPDSVLLDGEPVPVSAGDGYADVAVGDVASGGSGVLLYRLRLHSDATGLVPGAVEMRYGDAPVRERLSPATVRVAGLTIAGPGSITSDRLPLSGRAPAGSLVEILHGDALLGQAVATPGGHWSQTVTLPLQQRAQPLHRVVAQTTLEGQRLTAEHEVVVDHRRPVATSVSMYQVDGDFPNGRTFTFDPRDGVARFPFVFVPGQPLVVDVTFDHPELVESAEVHIGSQWVSAIKQPDGTFRARMSVSSVNGPVRLSYEAAARPIDMTEPEQEPQEIRDQVPAPLQGFEISDVSEPDSASTGPRAGAFTASVPSVAGGSVRWTLTVSRDTHTITTGDVLSQASSGSSVYGLTWSRSGNTLNFSFVVPLSELPGLERSPIRTLLEKGGQPLPRSAGTAVGVARVGYQLAFNGATTLDSLLSAFGAGEKYQKLADAVDAAAGCSPGKASAYAERAQNIALAAAAGDIGGSLFNIGALVFGPATFGLGTVALGVLGWALDKAIGYAIDQATETLMNDIRGDDDCEDDEEDEDDEDDEDDDEDDEDDDKEDLADPTWIYDPSGYTFEGTRSARVGGVTATLLTAPTADGPWSTWDAEWFGQTNPQTTDDAGRYGWDVPEGWWKVAYTKEGYLPAHSRVLRVLPPHLDVDVSLTKEGFPHVTSAVLADGGIDVRWDRMVRSSSLDALRVEDGSGAPVPGTWSAVEAGDDESGRPLQRGARFTPTAGFTAGSELTVTVEQVVDYSGRPMTAPYTVALRVPQGPGGGGPTDPPVEDEAPAAPTGVTAVAGERSAEVTWAAPGDGGSPITSYVVTAVQTGQQLTVEGDTTSTTVGSLTPGEPHSFTVTARNDVGTGPASAPSNVVVPTAVAPETAITAGPADASVLVARRATVAWTAAGPQVQSWLCELDGEPLACGGGSAVLRSLTSGTHTFTVAAVDADGDADPTPATRTWTVPRDDRDLTAGKAWRPHRDDRAFDGTYLQTSSRGAVVSGRVAQATSLALVVGKGRRHGKVVVWLGQRRLGAVALAADSVRHGRVVPVATFDDPRSGRVRIEVRSRGRVVRIDGLAVTTD